MGKDVLFSECSRSNNIKFMNYVYFGSYSGQGCDKKYCAFRGIGLEPNVVISL